MSITQESATMFPLQASFYPLHSKGAMVAIKRDGDVVLLGSGGAQVLTLGSGEDRTDYSVVTLTLDEAAQLILLLREAIREAPRPLKTK